MKRIHIEVAPQRNRVLPWKITIGGRFIEGFAVRDRAVQVAVGTANGIADDGGLVTLKLKGRNGQVQDERTYPRSSDPRETKG